MRESLFVRQRDRLVEHLEDLWKRCNYSFGLPIPSTNILFVFQQQASSPEKETKQRKSPKREANLKFQTSLVLCVFFSSNCKVLLQYSKDNEIFIFNSFTYRVNAY